MNKRRLNSFEWFLDSLIIGFIKQPCVYAGTRNVGFSLFRRTQKNEKHNPGVETTLQLGNYHDFSGFDLLVTEKNN